ncbi:MAG: hypothetical protein AVDCRST_MAG85-1985, partial [uncultured Solirubrobacteraceae bacterium]
ERLAPGPRRDRPPGDGDDRRPRAHPRRRRARSVDVRRHGPAPRRGRSRDPRLDRRPLRPHRPGHPRAVGSDPAPRRRGSLPPCAQPDDQRGRHCPRGRGGRVRLRRRGRVGRHGVRGQLGVVRPRGGAGADAPVRRGVPGVPARGAALDTVSAV